MDASSGPPLPRRTDLVAVLWLIGSSLLLLGPVVYWSTLSTFDLVIPRSPVLRINETYSRQLALVEQAKALIPSGATYTAVAIDRDDEMSLFMLSLGALWDRRPMPTSYFGGPREHGAEARYVISYRCEVTEPRIRLLGVFREGCVYERRGRS
jgi:hypothetical protein